jgi:hypothetical protein
MGQQIVGRLATGFRRHLPRVLAGELLAQRAVQPPHLALVDHDRRRLAQVLRQAGTVEQCGGHGRAVALRQHFGHADDGVGPDAAGHRRHSRAAGS